MTLFEPYKATPDAILAQRTDALGDISKLDGLKSDIRAQHRKAHGSLSGILLAPIETLMDPTYQKVEQISRLRLVSSASLLQWATDVKTYNAGIDKLNAEYEAAAGSSFGVDADEYFMHGAGIPLEQKQHSFNTAVVHAKTALLERLKHEKHKLDGELDDNADEAKTTLNKDPSDETLNELYQGGLLPLQINLLFPSIEVDKVDIATLVANLQRLGMLPPGTSAERIASLYATMTSGSTSPMDVLKEMHGTLGNLDAASPEELSLLVSLLTPDQIAAWDARLKAVQSLENRLPGKDGPWLRLDAFHDILSKVSPDLVMKVVAAVPDLNPGFTHTDGYIEGHAPQRDDPASGWHWGDPTGPLFGTDDGDATNNYLNIQQGSFGDCWMITNIIAATQKNPNLPGEHVSENANGTVTVVVYDKDGNPHDVTVTDQVVLDENGQPVGARGENGSTWVTYYEKALALAYTDDDGGAHVDHDGDPDYDRPDNGNYAGLEWDNAENGAPYVTGHDADGVDVEFDDVKDAFVDDGRPVLVSTYSDDDVPSDPPDGYVTQHQFYVKEVIDVEGDDNDKIVLGNPWGGDAQDVTVTRDQFEDFFQSGKKLEMP